MGVHPDLRHELRLSYALGAVFTLVGLGVVVFFISGEWNREGISPTCVVLYGVIMLALGWNMLVWNPRHYRRATWVLENVPPEKAHLTLREETSSDSTSLYADLRPVGAKDVYESTESYWVGWPKWDTKSLDDPEVEVYRDPWPGGPVVIRTSKGIFWPYLERRVGLPTFPRLKRR